MKLPGIAALALLAACSASRATTDVSPLVMPNDTALDDTLVVALGHAGVTDDKTVRVTFKAKGPDSRCAANVTCVWAGDVSVALVVETAQTTADGSAHTAVEPKIVWAGQHQVSLLDVTPRPGESDNGPVTAKLRVVRLGR
jgi:hypothetical protein